MSLPVETYRRPVARSSWATGTPSIVKQDRILGIVKRCARCREWWPLDDTFYYPSNTSWCRACYVEYHHKKAS